MGRPLYSRTFITTPAVRDPEPPVCEKWSHLNAFDPDSDEFFDNENTVYEDFISPVTPISSAEDDEEDERDMLVVRMGNISPSSSLSSLSDSDSPLALTPEEPSPLAMRLFRDSRHFEEDLESALMEPAVRVRLAGRTSEARRPRRQLATRGTLNRSYHAQRSESLPVPPPSAPIPVPPPSRRAAFMDEHVALSPSTPPRQTSMAHFAMSPPPTSTPRLYTWARNPGHPTSPSTGGPFTNPFARASYAHLSPVFIRIRDVAV